MVTSDEFSIGNIYRQNASNNRKNWSTSFLGTALWKYLFQNIYYFFAFKYIDLLLYACPTFSEMIHHHSVLKIFSGITPLTIQIKIWGISSLGAAL